MQVCVAEGVTRTRNHWWWRPWWTPDTRHLFFYLTFPTGDLAAATRPAREALGRIPDLDALGDTDLHVTLRRIGPEAEAADADLNRVVDAVFAAASALPTGALTFDTALVVDEGVLLPTDAPWLTDLDAAQRSAIESVLGVRDEGSTWHHASLAYAHGEADAAVIAGRLTSAVAQGWAQHDPASRSDDDGSDPAGPAGRASEPGAIEARPTLEAVSLARDGHRYVWRTLGSLPL